MDDLTYTLRTLCLRNRDGSHATQADRLRTLALMSQQLREGGFRQMRATSLKGKHVDVLIARWQFEGLSAGTLKNRVAHLRWWAEKVGKAGVIPADKAQLAIPDRQFVTNESKARQLGDHLNRVSDPCVRMSLELQAAFGLRREESIKFQPATRTKAITSCSRVRGRRADGPAPFRSRRRNNAPCSIGCINSPVPGIDPASQELHSAATHV